MKGQHHDGEDEAGGQDADAIGRPGEQRGQHRNIGECADQRGLHGSLQEGREDEEAPDAVDDRRDPGQKLDRDADRAAQPMRAKFSQENRDANPDRHGEDHGDRGCRQRAVNGRESAEFLGDRIPGLRRKKSESESPEGGERAYRQSGDDAAKDQQHRDRGGERRQAKPIILEPQPAQGPQAIAAGGDAVDCYVRHGSSVPSVPATNSRRDPEVPAPDGPRKGEAKSPLPCARPLSL